MDNKLGLANISEEDIERDMKEANEELSKAYNNSIQNNVLIILSNIVEDNNNVLVLPTSKLEELSKCEQKDIDDLKEQVACDINEETIRRIGILQGVQKCLGLDVTFAFTLANAVQTAPEHKKLTITRGPNKTIFRLQDVK